MTHDSQQLRESMWDLVYGLLSDEESQALIARIKSDPAAARLYSEVRLQADLIGQAACVGDDSLVLNAETATRPKVVKAGKTPARGNAIDRRDTVFSRRVGAWLAGIGATALAALLAVGLIWTQPSEKQLAAAFAAADVSTQPRMQAGLPSNIALRTYRLDASGEPANELSAQVDLRLIAPDGRERSRQSVQTDKAGFANVELPGEALEPGVRLEIATGGDKEAVEFPNSKDQQPLARSVALPVDPEPQISYVLQAEPPTESGKAVPATVWNFSAFSATPSSIEQLEVAPETRDASRQEQLALAETQRRGAGESTQLQAGVKAEGAAYAFADVPARKLQIELPQTQERFAPGQEVELNVRVTDEAGRPAPNTRLGVRVWNEQLTRQAAERPLAITEAVQAPAQQAQSLELAPSQLTRSGRIPDADRDAARLPSETKNEAPANQRSLAEPVAASAEPVLLATNRDEVAATMRAATERANASRQRTRSIIGAIAVTLSAALIIVLCAFALAKLAVSVRIMAPAVLVAAASFVLGLSWVQWPSPGSSRSIARAPAAASLDESTQDDVLPRSAPAVGGYGAASSSPKRGEPADASSATPPATSATPAERESIPAATQLPAPQAPALARAGQRDVERLQEAESLERPRALVDQQAQSSTLSTQLTPGNAGGFGAGRALAARGAGANVLRDERADAKSITAAEAPAALYFNPELNTDENGRATVRFVMPAVSSEYRLMIDALGNNRIGARQEILVCDPNVPPAAAKPPEP